MTSGANPQDQSQEDITRHGNPNGATNTNHAGTENAGLEHTLAALRHHSGISVDWSREEQSILEDLLPRYSSDTIIVRYAKIAQQLKDKTVRDVALRCKWMSKKESGKQRKDDQNSSRKNKDKKEKAADPSLKSSQATSCSSGPSHAQPAPSIDNDDGISYKDIGGATGQLLEQNAQAFDQISANFAGLKIQENISLFCQTRNNILTILNEIEANKVDIPKQMPQLTVKLNEELAKSILPLTSVPVPYQAVPMPDQSMPVSSRSMPVLNQAVPVQNQSVLVPNQSMPVPNQSMPMPNQRMPVPNQSVPVQNQVMRMPNQSMPVLNKVMPMPSQSLPVTVPNRSLPVLVPNQSLPVPGPNQSIQVLVPNQSMPVPNQS